MNTIYNITIEDYNLTIERKIDMILNLKPRLRLKLLYHFLTIGSNYKVITLLDEMNFQLGLFINARFTEKERKRYLEKFNK